MAEENGFDSWGIVEIMGHQRIAGRLTEQVIAGAALLRVDVPELTVRSRTQRNGQPIKVDTFKAFTKFYGSGAIYAITPTDEDTARLAAASLRVEPYERWQFEAAIPALPAATPFDPPGFGDDDSYQDDDQPDTDDDGNPL